MTSKLTLGGGCFWCIEAVMKDVKGVKSAISGYAGGSTDNPSYRGVASGGTGHAEVVQVEFDEQVLSTEDVLEIFFAVHNPESKNREGPDIGSQYRSIVLYKDEEQKSKTEDIINRLENNGVYTDIVTEVEPLEDFYKAEPKHQDFFEKNPNYPYCQAHIPQKLEKLRNNYPSLSEKTN
jgi:peptide-methionine (S)-S-oxide reductase